MGRLLTTVLVALVVTSCSSGSDALPATSAVAAPANTPAVTASTTLPSTTTILAATTTTEAPTTTLAPTGTVQSCPELRTFDDPDADGWGECIVSLEDAQQQYFFISGAINAVILPMGDSLSAAECPAYLEASKKFVDDMKAAEWPPTVTDQLNELVQAEEFELFLRREDCKGDVAQINEALARISAAVFAWRQAIGAPTDF